MSDENFQSEQPKAKDKTINIVLDTSLQIKELNNIIAQKDETIKCLLAEHKEKFELETERKKIESSMDKKPTNYDAQNTASILNEPSYQKQHNINSIPIDLEDSNVPPEWVKSSSVPELLQTVEKLSHVAENKGTYQKILSKMVKKVINNSSKPFDITMTPNCKSKDFLKSELPINEFDSSEVKAEEKSIITHISSAIGLKTGL